MSKHTPTPWELVETIDGVFFYQTENKKPHLRLGEMFKPADAQYVLKCVNMHDELVEALKMAVEYFDGQEITGGGIPTMKAALAKAEAE